MAVKHLSAFLSQGCLDLPESNHSFPHLSLSPSCRPLLVFNSGIHLSQSAHCFSHVFLASSLPSLSSTPSLSLHCRPSPPFFISSYPPTPYHTLSLTLNPCTCPYHTQPPKHTKWGKCKITHTWGSTETCFYCTTMYQLSLLPFGGEGK